MTEQKERSTVERIQSFYEAFATKGIEGAAEFLNEDEFSWHVPGENPLSGVYHGVDGYKELGRKMSDTDEWGFEVRDIIPNDDLALVLMRVRGERKGKQIDLEGAHVFRLDGAGKIAEGWGFVQDQRTLDDFLS